jgi:hypothetical protein
MTTTTTTMMRSYSSYLLPLLLALCLAKDSKVLVHIPFPIHDPAGFDHVKAEFGFDGGSSAGHSLANYVYYMEETLCYPVNNMTVGYPVHDGLRKTPFILLINGGGACSAVTKVRHAQHIGASAVLLAAPRCLCNDAACLAKFPEDSSTNCKSADPILVNDGSGWDISIPSFLIFKPFGEALKAELRKNQPCLVELQWGLQDVNISRAHMQLAFWTSAYDPLVSLETYVDVRSVVTAFDTVAVFAPRYNIIDGERFNCLSAAKPDPNGPCDHLCTNHGRYCTLHAVNLSGNAIVKETLRRLCIWKHFSGNVNAYWDYTIYHKQECGSPDKFADPKCIEQAMKVAKIDESTVAHCMADAGSLVQDVPNALLDEAVREHTRSGVVSLPALTVNHKVLYYAASARSLFDTVCSDYWLSGVDQIPAVCETCSACPNTVGCVQEGKCVDFSNDERHPETGFAPKNKGHRGWKIFWTLALLGAAAGAAWHYYGRQWWSGHRRGSVRLMDDYLNLSGEEE